MRAAGLRLHDWRHRLGKAHWPRQVDGDDPVPHLHRQIVEVGKRDRLVISSVVDKNVEAAEIPGHVADHPLHRGTVDDVAGECRGVDLISRGQLARNTVGLVVALGIHDGYMDTLLRQRVTDPLPEPAIPARHQGNRALRSMSSLSCVPPTVCYLTHTAGKLSVVRRAPHVS